MDIFHPIIDVKPKADDLALAAVCNSHDLSMAGGGGGARYFTQQRSNAYNGTA